MPIRGFKRKGAGLLSGKGSIVITAIPPARLVGKVVPAGAFVIKSSPGKGGPANGPEKGFEASAPLEFVKTPVVMGFPFITAHPSNLHPDGNAGKLKPTAGEPLAKLTNHKPLNSSVAEAVVGVAKTYLPVADKKLLFNAAGCPIVNAALFAEKPPANK